ncbi:HU family DNA-binding protein [Kitasatospora indigofera]|uniref:HU family DNA-binding protein n=1 Tax=Kitasatospora indigofera TaxID=67307 RepID=UPI0033BE7491
MNKGQLVEAVAGQLGSRVAAEDAVDVVLDVMVRAVVAGEAVQVTGFGTLESVQRAARYARNPQTGERVRVKKTTVPRFRAGQGFKDLVSGTRKLPKTGPAVAKAPKGSLAPGKTVAAGPTGTKAAAKRSAAAPAVIAKKTTAKKAAAARMSTALATKKAAAVTRKTAPAGGKKTAAPAKRSTRPATA